MVSLTSLPPYQDWSNNAIDGGEIRGLSTFYILQNLMFKIKFIESMDTDLLLCDYFDMICGTNTGEYELSRDLEAGSH